MEGLELLNLMCSDFKKSMLGEGSCYVAQRISSSFAKGFCLFLYM